MRFDVSNGASGDKRSLALGRDENQIAKAITGKQPGQGSPAWPWFYAYLAQGQYHRLNKTEFKPLQS